MHFKKGDQFASFEKMATSNESAAQRAVIHCSASLGMIPVETHTHMKMVDRHKNVSQALVLKWPHRFLESVMSSGF